MIGIFTIYALTTPVPAPPMKATSSFLEQNSVNLKRSKTKIPMKLEMLVGNYASLINSHALTNQNPVQSKNGPVIELSAIQAQSLINMKPLICFFEEKGKSPAWKVYKKKGVAKSAN